MKNQGYKRLLKNIIIPDSVTLIESYAFSNTGLEEIIIPNSVVTIEERAFQNSSSLSFLYFEISNYKITQPNNM